MKSGRHAIWATVLLTATLPPILRADPLHAITGDAYWHHESNFVFPATLAGFTRIGAPQEVDGSTTVNAHHGSGDLEHRTVISIDLFPDDAGAVGFTTAISVDTIELGPVRGNARRATLPGDIHEVVYAIEHGNWRIVVRGRLQPQASARSRSR
jgi:hypothetical protein